MDVLELDISKYDKSQNEFHCAVEYEIWKRLGLNEFLAEVWKQGHRKTTLKDYIAGIKTCLWYQRKSGDVTTFIGNKDSQKLLDLGGTQRKGPREITQGEKNLGHLRHELILIHDVLKNRVHQGIDIRSDL